VSPSEIGLSLEDLIRRQARELIQRAVEVEVTELLVSYENVKIRTGQREVVQNGYLPAREILTAVGPVEVRVPKVCDRSSHGVNFTSALAPPYVRRSHRVSAALLWLKDRRFNVGSQRVVYSNARWSLKGGLISNTR